MELVRISKNWRFQIDFSSKFFINSLNLIHFLFTLRMRMRIEYELGLS